MMDKIAGFLRFDYLRSAFESEPHRVAIIIGASLVLGLLVYIVFRIIGFFSSKTSFKADDQIVEAVRFPAAATVFLVGLFAAMQDLDLPKTADFIATGIIKTFAVLVWGWAAMKIGSAVLEVMSRKGDNLKIVQAKTLPLFDIVMRVLVVGAVAYFVFVSWDINVTSWLASAGIVGIAVGFAAKDTLANLFSGIFILADAPYKIGDYVVLDQGLRGVVTDVGVRSTRILTRDDWEVTVPNAIIGNSRIVNEAGGRHKKMRVNSRTSVAYGSDVDQVKEVLLKASEGVEHVSDDPAPRVRFREMGDSGLVFDLLAWIEEPVYRGKVVDQLNTNVYKALNEAGIEIPFPQRDVHIKEAPSSKNVDDKEEEQ